MQRCSFPRSGCLLGGERLGGGREKAERLPNPVLTPLVPSANQDDTPLGREVGAAGPHHIPGHLPGRGSVPRAGWQPGCCGSRRDCAVLGPDASFGPSRDRLALGWCCGQRGSLLPLVCIPLGCKKGCRVYRGVGVPGWGDGGSTAGATLAAEPGLLRGQARSSRPSSGQIS